MAALTVRIGKNLEAARQAVDTTLGLLLGTGGVITAVRVPADAAEALGVAARGGSWGRHPAVRRKDLTDRVVIQYKPGKPKPAARRAAPAKAKPGARAKPVARPKAAATKPKKKTAAATPKPAARKRPAAKPAPKAKRAPRAGR